MLTNVKKIITFAWNRILGLNEEMFWFGGSEDWSYNKEQSKKSLNEEKN